MTTNTSPYFRALCWPAWLFLCLGACAQTPQPAQPTASILYRDLQRLVSVRTTTEWTVDRIEIDELLEQAMSSICAVPPPTRVELLTWLDRQLAQKGGPVEQAWRERGKNIDAVEDLLELTRIRKTLARAIKTADADCPFWIEPSDGFRGRQISDDRWTLSFGGGGKLIGVKQGSEEDISFGGAGRFLFGRTFGPHLSLYTGAEFGGSASFPRDDAGDRATVVLGFDAVIPLIMRYRMVNTYFEVEAGYLSHTTDEDFSDLDPGFRVGFAYGGRSTRTRFLFPGAVFGIAYERSWPNSGPSLNTLKLGFRVAIDWDL